jgi:hypothetical protein
MTGRLSSLSERTRDSLVIAVLALVSVAFLANVLFTDQVLVGDNLAAQYPWRAYASQELLARPTNGRTDPLQDDYPRRVIAQEMVRAGSLPLWNPYYLSGTPFLATEVLAGLFYPPNVIYYLMDPLRAFGLSAGLHLFLAGLFMYLYLRSISLDRVSALVGAVTFELSGYFLINLMWLSRVFTAAWAPLLFFSFEEYWKEKKLGYVFLLAFGLGMSILAGMPAVAVFVVFALGLYASFRVVVTLRGSGLTKAARGMAVVVAGVCLGTALAAVQLLPTYEATPFFERADWGYEETLDTGRAPLALATALVPGILANPWRPSVYGGVLTLLLALWAVTFHRNRYVFFFGALALLSLSLFLNIPDVLYRLLYLIPVFRVGRLMEVKIVYAFALSVLAAWGFSSLAGMANERSRSTMLRVSLLVLVLAGVGLAGVLVAESLQPHETGTPPLPAWHLQNLGSLGRAALLVLLGAALLLFRVWRKVSVGLFGSLAILLVVGDMYSFGWTLNPPQRAQDLFFETGSTRFLEADNGLFRIIRGPASDDVLPPNTAGVYGIADAQGYSSLVLDYYGEFMDLIEPGLAKTRRIGALSRVESLTSPLLDLLNVKYVLTEPSVSQELVEFDAAHDDIELVYDGEIKIYENTNVLPRAFVVHGLKVRTDKESVFSELTSQEFDPAAYVVLEEEPSNYSRAVRLSGGDSTARIMDYGPNKVIIEVYAASDGFLVLSDLYYNGWKAFVDGENEKVYKADYVFRAVRLTEGQHTVEFVFDPLSFQIGWRVSAMTAGIMGACLLIGSVRRTTRDRGQGSPVADPGERSPERAAL